MNISIQKLFFIVLFFNVFSINAQNSVEQKILEEAKARNVNTTNEVINELSKNGISLSQAQEMARMQGIDLNTFLKSNFNKSNTASSESLKNDIIDEIQIATDTIINDTNDKITQEKIDVDPNNNYFGYSIFKNNPFATKDYLVGNIDEGYLLSPGDELRLTVFGNNAYITEVKIDLNGNIIFPEMGVFQAAGNSLKTIKSRLKLFLGKFYNGLVSNPQQAFLDVSLTQIRPVKVNVLGQVVSPGPHLVNGLASALNALYAAGGVKTNGSLRNIKIYRNNKLLKEIDLYDFIVNGNLDDDIRLMSSDVVFVPTRGNSISIEGEVKNTGIFELKKGENFDDLLRFSGGFQVSASTQNINISRVIPFEDRTQDQIYDKFLTTINYQKNKEFILIDGDEISITKILDKELNLVNLEGSVNNPGTFSVIKYPDLKTLIEIAGKGISPDTYMNKVDISKVDETGFKSFKTYNLKSVLDGTTKVTLDQDDTILVYTLKKVEGEKQVSISGFGTDDKTIFWRENLSLFDVIFESTSFEELEFQSKVLTSRVDIDSFNQKTGKYSTKSYNLSDLVGIKNTYLTPKDRVRLYSRNVTENLDQYVQVLGAVNSPQKFDLNENMLVEDAILLAGGLQEFALSEVEIIRKLNTNTFFNKVIKYSIDFDYLLGFKKQPESPLYLKHYDVISVKKPIRADYNPFVTINGEINFPGSYSIESIQTDFKTLIEKAGGLTEYGFINTTKIQRDGKILGYKNKKDLYKIKFQSGDLIDVGSEIDNIELIGNGLNNSFISNYFKNKRIRYYLNQSGGLKNRIESIVILRKNGSSVKKHNLFSNPKIYPGDVIIVSQKPEKVKSDRSFVDEFSRIFGIISGTLTSILLVNRL